MQYEHWSFWDSVYTSKNVKQNIIYYIKSVQLPYGFYIPTIWIGWQRQSAVNMHA